MAQIDKYIQHLLRFEALSLMVTSNGPVVARLAGGAEKASTQTVEHSLLVAAVNESAPAGAMADIRASRMTKFQHPQGAPTVTVEVTPTPGAWKLVLTPLPPDPAAAARRTVEPPPAAPAESPRMPVADSPRLSRPDIARVTMRPESPRESPAAAPSRAPEAAAERASFVPRVPEAPRLPAAMPVTASVEDDRPGDAGAIDLLLRQMTRLGASDLHLATGRAPLIRLHGEIKPLPGDHLPLTAEALRSLINPTMKAAARKQYADHNDADYAHEIAGVARFRCNVMVERRGPSAVLRRIPMDIVSAEELGLSRAVLDLCDLSKGLVLTTGPTGSGKSTTLASLIDRINSSRKDHIITIEDPIEFVHAHKNCVVTQREVGIDTDSWGSALKNTLRQAPDVILMGEIRDREAMEHAVSFAETGHLCMATLHANNANQALDRIINFFPEERRAQLLMDLSLNLKAMVSQRLIPRQDGRGRVAVVEIMLNTPLISDMIFKGEVSEIKEIMKKSRNLGMQTFDQALFDAYEAKLITYEDALRNADSLNDLRLQIKLNSQHSKTQDLASGTENFAIV